MASKGKVVVAGVSTEPLTLYVICGGVVTRAQTWLALTGAHPSYYQVPDVLAHHSNYSVPDPWVELTLVTTKYLTSLLTIVTTKYLTLTGAHPSYYQVPDLLAHHSNY